MPVKENVALTRAGVLALPVSGVLLGVGNIGRDLALGVVVPAGQSAPGGLGYGGSENLDPVANPDGFARAVGSASYAVGSLMIVVGVALLIFGVFALLSYLATGPARRWALGATVLSVAGMALILPVFGVLAFAVPAAARAYLGGQRRALELIEALLGTPLVAWALVASVLFAAGMVLLGVAVWRSATLPRWAGVAYALSAPLIAFPLGGGAVAVMLGFLGLTLMLLGGGWLAVGVWQNPVGEATSGGRARVR